MGRRRLSDDIYNDLEHKILTGAFHVGDKLPTERELADQYATSRVPVRAAVLQLKEKGFIQTVPGSGSVIISQGNSIEGSAPVLLAAMPEAQDTRFLLETIRLRCLIESEGARLAAVNRTTEDIKHIQKSLFDSINEIRKLKMKESNSFFEADADFHRSIIEASKSPFLIACFNSIPLVITSHQYWSLKFTTPRDEVVSYHTSIYESILDENESKAYEAMKTHLSRVEALISLRAEDEARCEPPEDDI